MYPNGGLRGRVAEEEGDQVVDWIVLRPEELATFPKDQIVWRWVRMAKSKGNVVTPESMVERYGADSLRIHIMFVAPFEANVEWRETGVEAALRFLNRAWKWMAAALPMASQSSLSPRGEAFDRCSEGDRSMLRKLHKTIRKVDEDIERLRFNTAIAAIMELVNDLYLYYPPEATSSGANPAIVGEALETLVLLLAPFAPHMADEVWEALGHSGSTYHARWPQWDEHIAADEMISMAVQINGKVRDRITVPAGSDEATVRQAALESPKVAQVVEGHEIRRVVLVPDRLISFTIG